MQLEFIQRPEINSFRNRNQSSLIYEEFSRLIDAKASQIIVTLTQSIQVVLFIRLFVFRVTLASDSEVRILK